MKNTIIILSFLLILGSCGKELPHPRIYVSDDQKKNFTGKIESSEWAKSSYENLKSDVDTYVDRHVNDPEWIISRMQMYWDTHFERVYVNGNFFSHGTGRAPVPTVKFAGARDWETDYVMPSLDDTQPYMDEKGMYLQNMKKEGHPWEWVHPSKTGRIIGPMNDRIMALAAKAAFLYWHTGEEKYAVFASDILMTYVRGMHYRREPFALENYGNSHLMGLATFEVILDHLIPDMAVCYDFLYSYLKAKGEDFDMIANVFKRFADQQILYGVPDNNWNIFQARHVIYLALALESDSHYKDGKGRQYYIDQIFNHTTIRQFALKEAIVDIFDPETGMWPESATYSMSVCKDMLDIVCLIDNAENNHLVDSFPILKKAVPATVEYLFPNGNVTAFGDAKYVPLRAQPFEILIALYRKYGDEGEEAKLTKVLQKMINDGVYNRGKEKSMFSLFFNVDKLMDISPSEASYDHLTSNMFYAPNTSWLIQRNGKDPQNGMALTLVGSYGNHAQANGISLELYGKGLMLAPESSFGVSYGSRDNQEYYARFPAHNTVIVDGISDYGMMRSNHPYQFLSSFPVHGDTIKQEGNITYARVGFTEPRTNANQERLNSIIRIDEVSSYVVDIFRSARADGNDKKHEYVYHSIGDNMTLLNTFGHPLTLSRTDELSSATGDQKGYDYYKNKKSVAYTQPFVSRFHINREKEEDVFVDLWMKGYPGRTLFSVESPQSNAFVSQSVPDEFMNKPLPTLVVRQTGEAWKRPFVSVISPYTEKEGKLVSSVEYFGENDDYIGMTVRSDKRVDHIFNSVDNAEICGYKDMRFQGVYGVIGEKEDGLEHLFMGKGKSIGKANWNITAKEETDVSLRRDENGYILYTSGEIQLTIPVKDGHQPDISGIGQTVGKPEGKNQTMGTYLVTVPKGKYKLNH